MSAMASQITGVSLFAQPFVQAQIKAPGNWPLWGEVADKQRRSWMLLVNHARREEG